MRHPPKRHRRGLTQCAENLPQEYEVLQEKEKHSAFPAVKASPGTRIRESDRATEPPPERPEDERRVRKGKSANTSATGSREPDPAFEEPSVEDVIDRPSLAASVSTCPACRGHARAAHQAHHRLDDCLYKDIKPEEYYCPGCVGLPERQYGHHEHTNDVGCRWGKVDCPECLAKLPRSDEAHSLDDHCRWGNIRNVDQGKKRAGAHPRDPRVARSGEPTSTLRMGGGVSAGEGSKVKTGSSTSVAKSATKVDSETQAGSDDVSA